MTQQNRNRLVYRYARAFLNTYGSSISRADIDQIYKSAIDLEPQSKNLLLANRIYGMSSDPEALLHSITTACRLPPVTESLLKLLIQQRRIYLLVDILKKIYDFYCQQKGVMIFTVSSMPLLNEGEQKSIQEFVTARFGAGHIYCYTTDPDLIAGIRIQSLTIIWEFSCAQQLREMASTLTV